MGIPLGIGLVLGRLVLRKVSPALPHMLMIIANLLLVLAFLPILASLLPDLEALIGDGTILDMAAVIGVAVIGGHLLGGPDPSNRATLAFSASMRHPGIALALAGANHANDRRHAAVPSRRSGCALSLPDRHQAEGCAGLRMRGSAS